ncbi:diguanylate cyclase [Thiosulfativibrio zosterae]|uniref:diguanylate cyclase n=1 Tax=Thiosulfativibrio zosterae TaxID=2675053 RepID=A0A6F8PL80_9GAMM|nr:diguanylate cyclase [Thiosulfativibrio zosterae]BBP42859.1 diguanylate cyclase response regulator [Thiosulfativibrio zosterae]
MSSKEVILIIEDQLSIAMLLNAKLVEVCDYPILLLKSLAEVEEVLASEFVPIIALCDLTLPDAPHGETVKVLRKHKVTTIVLTGRYDNATRERMLNEMVADYVIKNGPAAIQYVVSTVLKLIQNSQRTVWILSPLIHNTQKLIGMLRVQRYKIKVFETYALVKEMLLTELPDLLVLESIEQLKEMPPLNFVEQVRGQYSANELPILACEPSENIFFAIHLMKYGVNDFFNANFTAEELYVRVHQNILQSESYRKIQAISQTDSLTGLHNRRYFFDQGGVQLNSYLQMGASKFLLMCDIDHFKKVNDTYGHQVGDNAIVFVAQLIKEVFNDCLVARFGGEEYCVFGGLTQEDVQLRAETLREKVEQESKSHTSVAFTLSLGVAFEFETLDAGVGFADHALYASKSNGRNLVSVYSNE